MEREEVRRKMNEWGQRGVPFLFVIDFEMQKPWVLPLADVNAHDALFSFRGHTNAPAKSSTVKLLRVKATSKQLYQSKFDRVLYHLSRGDSFLTNLTVESEVEIAGNLQDVFYASNAPYRFWMRDAFVCFSPESFVRVSEGHISTFPMKGTIDASVPNAPAILLNDQKETAEHTTIVDLLRNDLSSVAQHVHVKRFRYLEEVKTDTGAILQASSEIVGELLPYLHQRLGDVIFSLLPAGSISGAPKEKTCRIIQETEDAPRGYYTGVAGIFDGHQLDSAVLIRFIEQRGDRYYYRSGGGITTQSDPDAEYQEVLKKIYVSVG